MVDKNLIIYNVAHSLLSIGKLLHPSGALYEVWPHANICGCVLAFY